MTDKINQTWDQVADKESVEKTIASLKANGIEASYALTKEEAVEQIFKLIPQGVEIMDMTSVTLSELGVVKELEESGKYNATKKKMYSMDKATQGREMKRMGAAPDYAIGSVHSVTQDGKVMIASNTGSQLPAYAYGADHVVWVVGTQKIVKDLDSGMKRVYDYVLPLESDRAHKAYGVAGSFVSKILVVNREVTPGRIHIIFVNDKLGF